MKKMTAGMDGLLRAFFNDCLERRQRRFTKLSSQTINLDLGPGVLAIGKVLNLALELGAAATWS